VAEGDSRRERTRFLGSELRLMLFLLVSGELLGIGAAAWTWRFDHELSRLFATAATTLLFGALLSGVVTLLITDFDRRRVQRAAQLDFIANVLSDLKAVYDQVDRGRTLIKAHRSAKTYGEEMHRFIEARVKLQNVVRALWSDERGDPIKGVRHHVVSMEKYLYQLIEEYEKEYKEISLAQSIFEARLKSVLEAKPPVDSLDALPPNVPWHKLERLERLKEFLLPALEADNVERTSGYAKSFLGSLDSASKQLRTALVSPS
jgi:hypothetical protein